MAASTLSATAQPASAAPAASTAAPAASTSADQAWTTTGDAFGFHVMVADAKDGYGWRTAASLSEPGFDTDMWIGNACVTGPGQRAVVVYAPRTFTNKPQLMARGGFTAVVDLATGAVTKLNLQASLSYYNPGCGVDETAVLTQSMGEDKTSTRLIRVDAATGTLSAPIETTGQVTSAVPTKDGSIVAADAGALVKIAPDGKATEVAKTNGVPFRVTADKDGGVVYLDKTTAPAALTATPPAAGSPVTVPTAQAKRVGADQIKKPNAIKTKPTLLATGPLTETGVSRDAAGTVYVTGPTTKNADKLPGATKLLPTAPKDARVSTLGETVVANTTWADGKDSRISPDEATAPRPVKVDLKTTATGKTTTAVVDPAAKPSANIAQGKDRSPKLSIPRTAPTAVGAQAAPQAQAASSPTDIVESDRTCSVTRNDPGNQAMQPKPRQVEWAVDQAIVGNLNNKISRPANWKNLGMPAYQPQTLFPFSTPVGGSRVPAQIMLGIAAQESNMWQAARMAVPGVTGNPLIGNFYGIDYYDGDPANDWDIDWSDADCGYGVTQVTDGMRLAGREKPGETALPYPTQRAVALDYATNIAAGLSILTDKWNQTRGAGLVVNDGDPLKIENWFFALWAYNSGFYPNPGNGDPWGVGWANNPANPEWDAGRLPFLETVTGADAYSHAAHPQDWPYPEKVIGWAGHPIEALESPGKMVSGYRQAWWNGTDGDALTNGTAKQNRALAKPAEDLFCSPLYNNCAPGYISDGAANEVGQGPCQRADYKCWWNQPVTWKTNCSYSCGNDLVRFNTTYSEEADGTAYPPNCGLGGLPSGALIVDNLPDHVPSIRPNCGHPWTNAGNFTMTFGNDPNATEIPAKVDTHQLGAGFGGHFYFAHTRADDAKGQLLKVTGDWRLNQPINNNARVLVHLPDHGAQTTVTYEINTDTGLRRVTIDQAKDKGTNRWVDLGVHRFKNTVPAVRLTSVDPSGTGDKDVAFDAVAFVPGDYVDFPGILLPAPNPNAPDIDYSGGGTPVFIPAPPGPLSEPTLGRAAATEDPCASGTSAVTSYGCSQEATTAAEQSIAATVSNLTSLCLNEAFEGTKYNRFEGCRITSSGRAQDTVDGTTYIAKFGITAEIKLEPKSGIFTQKITVVPISIDPRLGWLDVNFTFGCGTSCIAGTPSWSNGHRWLPGTVLTQSTQTVNFQWIGAAETENTFQVMSSETIATQEHSVTNDYALWPNIRCDRKIGDRAVAGCVFPHYTPDLEIDYAKRPGAAAFYWATQEKLPNHPGSKRFNSPLHRESDENKVTTNRGRMCELTAAQWTPNPLSNDPLDSPPRSNSSCDEYPFARSKESGGQSQVYGISCAQLMVIPQGTPLGSSWKLQDNNLYDLPKWNEPCGRASVPLNQNSNAGGDLGRFTVAQRVLDNDAYYVVIPQLAGCNFTSVCDLRNRP